MSKVAVVYFSATGNTEGMANAVIEQLKADGAEVSVFTAGEFTSADGFDAYAFGCPAMGSEVLEESEFQPMWDSIKGSLAGKKVGLFGSFGWGDGQWMRDWVEDAKGVGANLVNDGVICMAAAEDDTIVALQAMADALIK